MKQYEAVIETLERLGGAATLGQLYNHVFDIDSCTWNTKTPFASIRRIVQTRPEIFKIRPGLWGLESYRKKLENNGIAPRLCKNAPQEDERFTHSYFQGLLLYLGALKNYQTYSPPQDKNKLCVGTKLNDISTIRRLPPYSYPELVKRSSTIDAIWLTAYGKEKDLLMPQAFFEVEHSTNIQDSLLKFMDLEGFSTRMVIVADKKRRDEFLAKLKFNAFRPLNENNRVEFLSYDTLVAIYEKESELASLNFRL